MMNKYLSSLSEENKQKRLSGFPLGVGTVNDVSNVCTFSVELMQPAGSQGKILW